MDESAAAGKGMDRLPHPPEIRNPVVEKALVELRKVVNGVIRKYGKPDNIHLEIARDLKQPKKVRPFTAVQATHAQTNRNTRLTRN